LSQSLRTWFRNQAYYKGLQTDEERNHALTIWEQSKRSKVWESFSQGVAKSDGMPWVICMKCQFTLNHPGIKGTGTSALQKHLKSTRCRRVTNGEERPSLQARMVTQTQLVGL